jgi:hypothetical protein
MEESEDVRFAEVNCLEEGSEELCKGQSYEAGTRHFPDPDTIISCSGTG